MQADKHATLAQMLEAREHRAAKQRRIIAAYAAPLLSLTVNMPGPCKSEPVVRDIIKAGYRAVLDELTVNGLCPVYVETPYELPTGPEVYIAVSADKWTLKNMAVRIEERHPLGRLLDIDVLGRDGIPVSRDDLGHPRRKCLICGQDAHGCARSRAHPVPELLKAVRVLTDAYFRQETGCAGNVPEVKLTIGKGQGQ